MGRVQLLFRASVVVIITVTQTLSLSLTIDEIAEEQAQLTRDIFTFFQEQMREQEMSLEERIDVLEAKVAEVESRPIPAEPEKTEPDTHGEESAARREEQSTSFPDNIMTNRAIDMQPPPAGEVPEQKTMKPTSGMDVETMEPAMKPTSSKPIENITNSRIKSTPSTIAPDDPEPFETEKPMMSTRLQTTSPTMPPATTSRATTRSATISQTTTLPLSSTKYEVSCAAIYKSGYTTSGEYSIDPDGSGAIAPFVVYCDMETTEGLTMVGHNLEEENIEVNGWERPGSFVLEPVYDYGTTIRQLAALADVSSECKQYAKYMCKASGIMELDAKSGLTYAWWVDRYGEKRVNWAGAPTDSTLCACGVTQSCFMESPTCNCDHRRAKNQVDEGYFDDKDYLPIRSLHLGDTGSKKERGAVTLGKLICRG